MRNKITAAFVAGGVLILAGLATAAISAPSAASAQDDEFERDHPHPGVDILNVVLSDLVEEGVLDQEQADAVIDAVESKADQLRETREAGRTLLRGLFEDGVLTADEAEQLPEDHFLLSERFDEAWEDGELTRDELGFRRGFRRGFHHGYQFGSAVEATSL
jgi:polyhydroxyalkanoate synthesis regulator phasin